MDITAGINQKIKNRDSVALRSLFILGDKLAIRNLTNTNFTLLTPPFNELLQYQLLLNQEPTIKHFKSLLNCVKEKTLECWIYPLYDENLFTLFKLGKIDQEATAKQFQILFQEYVTTLNQEFKNIFLPKVVNYLLYFYLQMKNFKMFCNLFSVSQIKNICEKKQNVIFHYFKGLYLLKKKEYIDSHEAFKVCFKIKNTQIKNMVAPYLIITGLILNKYPSYNTLEKYKMTEFKNIINSVIIGDISGYENNIENIQFLLLELHLYEYFNIYLYYFMFHNTIKELHKIKSINNKLYFKDIEECLIKLNILKKDEVIFIIANLIDKELIIGSINFENQYLEIIL